MVVDLPKSGQPLIEVAGLADLRKDMRHLGKEYQKILDKELKAAVRPIVADAKKRYRKLHPRRRSGKGSQRGLRGGSRKGQPTVNIGTAKYPYLQGQEWGSNQYAQFPRWIPAEGGGPGAQGRFWWPAVQEGVADAREGILSSVDSANRRVFRGGL